MMSFLENTNRAKDTLMCSAIPKDNSNFSFCSAGIAARLCSFLILIYL